MNVQMIAMFGSIMETIQSNLKATEATTEAMKARLDGMQENSVKFNPFLPAEPATFKKDRLTDPDLVSKDVEPDDSDEESVHSSERSHRPRRNRSYSRHRGPGSVRKCPELSPEDIENIVVLSSSMDSSSPTMGPTRRFLLA